MRHRQLLFSLVAAVTLVVPPALPQSSTNGVYGGYVGSDRWFDDMRRYAANQAAMQNVAGTSDYRRLPPDYVEVAGQIVFPEGNPFPRKRLPDLRIKARDEAADPVDRAPTISETGNFFYTVFKKGLQYDLSWMYYFGDRERFASIYVDPSGPSPRTYVFEYRHSAATITAAAPQPRLIPLASGSSVQVSLDAATGLNGVLSATQYTLEVTSGTAKLALSAETSLDANLYVRRNAPAAPGLDARPEANECILIGTREPKWKFRVAALLKGWEGERS